MTLLPAQTTPEQHLPLHAKSEQQSSAGACVASHKCATHPGPLCYGAQIISSHVRCSQPRGWNSFKVKRASSARHSISPTTHGFARAPIQDLVPVARRRASKSLLLASRLAPLLPLSPCPRATTAPSRRPSYNPGNTRMAGISGEPQAARGCFWAPTGSPPLSTRPLLSEAETQRRGQESHSLAFNLSRHPAPPSGASLFHAFSFSLSLWCRVRPPPRGSHSNAGSTAIP